MHYHPWRRAIMMTIAHNMMQAQGRHIIHHCFMEISMIFFTESTNDFDHW